MERCLYKGVEVTVLDWEATDLCALIRYDGPPKPHPFLPGCDLRNALVMFHHLIRIKENIVSLKTTVTTALNTLLAAVSTDNPKDAAVRRYAVAAEITRIGEAQKKKAKKGLEDLGLIVPGSYAPGTSEAVFDSKLFTMTATTKEPGSRLDETALREALAKEKLSGAAIARVLSASRKDNAPATSFTVDEK